MIVEKILGNRSDYPVNGRTIDQVGLEWYELEKKLMRKKTESGEEIGIRISEHMKDGDILYADNTRLIVVDVLPADLTVVPVATMQEMGRLCFELGNRHLSLSIGDLSEGLAWYQKQVREKNAFGFHPVALGIYAAELGFAQEELLVMYGYSVISAIVNNVVKLVPLSQLGGQRILFKEMEKLTAFSFMIDILTRELFIIMDRRKSGRRY